ncbi:TNF receptor-associated factor 5 isoform X2 [Sceloporus undulatus]|uniref:TNF receptor-associated factor 5 isoform X2 n=1 Tax=Sceloporus undulatus TaxID=8520 RepID=UPI001C4CA028|nr:TNF receptor-associated factor 5 isoform X2 [Sceloporus undulatus]
MWAQILPALLVSLRELNVMPTCPLDNEIIKLHEVFRDNCCNREVLNLQVYCRNSPACNVKSSLGRYQDHLQQCSFESVQCTNEGCCEKVLQKDLKEHLGLLCKYRKELCQYCNQSVTSVNLKTHERTGCPDYPLICPHGCMQIILTKEIKRGKLSEHENIYLRDHMLQILERNLQLEDQV